MAFLTPEEREQIQQRRNAREGSNFADNGLPGRDVRQLPGLSAVEEGLYNNSAAPAAADPRVAPAPATSSYYDQARARQQALIDRLHGIATGQTKSPAQELYEQQVQQAQSQNMSTSASLRDVGPGGQRQIAQRNAGNITARGAEQGAILKAQQQQQAEMALAQLYEQQRTGDLGYADVLAEYELGLRELGDNMQTQGDNRNVLRAIRDSNRRFNMGASQLGITMSGMTSGDKFGRASEAAATGFGYLAHAGDKGSGGGGDTSLKEMNKPSYGWGGPGA